MGCNEVIVVVSTDEMEGLLMGKVIDFGLMKIAKV